MRYIFVALLVSISCAAIADVAGKRLSPTERSWVLTELFNHDIKSFHKRLENHFLEAQTDSRWSPQAKAELLDWFAISENSEDVVARCTADMCAADFFVPYSVFLEKYWNRAKKWDEPKKEGFLPASFYFKSSDGSIRYFVFRDTFEPKAL